MPRLDPSTWVCDGCGKDVPIRKAYSPVAPVHGGDPTKQALCTPCYLQQYAQVYPDGDLPDIED